MKRGRTCLILAQWPHRSWGSGWPMVAETGVSCWFSHLCVMLMLLGNWVPLLSRTPNSTCGSRACTWRPNFVHQKPCPNTSMSDGLQHELCESWLGLEQTGGYDSPVIVPIQAPSSGKKAAQGRCLCCCWRGVDGRDTYPLAGAIPFNNNSAPYSKSSRDLWIWATQIKFDWLIDWTFVICQSVHNSSFNSHTPNSSKEHPPCGKSVCGQACWCIHNSHTM